MKEYKTAVSRKASPYRREQHESHGRVSQKRRTREALLAAAEDLVGAEMFGRETLAQAEEMQSESADIVYAARVNLAVVLRLRSNPVEAREKDEDAYRFVGSRLQPGVTRVPDGEPGERANWVLTQTPHFLDNPTLDVVDVGGKPLARLDAGATGADVRFPAFAYRAHATAS